jgi:hypothetical protein
LPNIPNKVSGFYLSLHVLRHWSRVGFTFTLKFWTTAY